MSGHRSETRQRQHAVPRLRRLSFGSSALIHAALVAPLTLLPLAPSFDKDEPVRVTRDSKDSRIDRRRWRDLHKISKPRTERPFAARPLEIEALEDAPRGSAGMVLSARERGGDCVVDAYGLGGGALGRYGTAAGTEKASLMALHWLVRHQAPDGRWSAARWQERCGAPPCSDPGQNRGDDQLDVAVTGAALLAFIGHRQREGFRPEIRRGLRWLLARQAPDGSLGVDESGELFNHAVASLALCNASLAYDSPAFDAAAQRAIGFIPRALSPSRARLLRLVSSERDLLTTGWLALAFEAARSSGIEMPRATGVFPRLRATGAPLLLVSPEGTLRSDAEMRALALSNRRGGCADGSWDPPSEDSIAGGRVYTTAVNALSLEVYDRDRPKK